MFDSSVINLALNCVYMHDVLHNSVKGKLRHSHYQLRTYC